MQYIITDMKDLKALQNKLSALALKNDDRKRLLQSLTEEVRSQAENNKAHAAKTKMNDRNDKNERELINIVNNFVGKLAEAK